MVRSCWSRVKVINPSRVVISALGMREGLLYELLDAEQRAQDPLLCACEELSFLRSRSPRHAHELADGPRWRSASSAWTRPRRRRACAMPLAC